MSDPRRASRNLWLLSSVCVGNQRGCYYGRFLEKFKSTVLGGPEFKIWFCHLLTLVSLSLHVCDGRIWGRIKWENNVQGEPAGVQGSPCPALRGAGLRGWHCRAGRRSTPRAPAEKGRQLLASPVKAGARRPARPFRSSRPGVGPGPEPRDSEHWGGSRGPSRPAALGVWTSDGLGTGKPLRTVAALGSPGATRGFQERPDL